MSNIIINQLKENGVAILKNLYTIPQITNLENYYKDLNNLDFNNFKKSKYIYKTHFDKERVYSKNFYINSEIEAIEITKGRYDIYYKNCYMNLHTKVFEIMNHFMNPENRNHKWGYLTSSMQSDNGHWHRDTVNICGDADENGMYDDSAMVHNFNPFYFTVLIPLVPLTLENGTPEFIKGSHKMTYQEIQEKNNKHLRFETEIGDAIIFDGRIFHRGCENKSNLDRPVLYNMIQRDWYHEN